MKARRQRMTAAFLLPLIIIDKKVSSTFLLNLSLFWHINEGIEEIMADYVHQTRNFLLVYLRLFLLIVIKDVFLSLVFFFLNKSKNLMEWTELIWSIVLETLICASGLESNLLWKAITRVQEEVWNPLFVSLNPFHSSFLLSPLMMCPFVGGISLYTDDLYGDCQR